MCIFQITAGFLRWRPIRTRRTVYAETLNFLFVYDRKISWSIKKRFEQKITQPGPSRRKSACPLPVQRESQQTKEARQESLCS